MFNILKRGDSNDSAQVELLYSGPIVSTFPMVRIYCVGQSQQVNIKTHDIYHTKNATGFTNRDILSIIGVDDNIQRTFEIKTNLIEGLDSSRDILDILPANVLDDMRDELNANVYWQIGEFGRITSTVYGRHNKSIERLTISERTKPRVILDKILMANNVMEELTTRSAKSICCSSSIIEKMKELDEYSVVENMGILKIPSKEFPLSISVYPLPSKIDARNPNSIIISAVDPGLELPGLVGIFNDLKIEIYRIDRYTSKVNITQSWALKACGTKPEFYYVRFFET